MCTVSIIRVGTALGVAPASLRIVCNRDESRARPPSAAPRWRSYAGGRAIWPMDLEAGGTWIGATEQGLVLCLLNLNEGPAPSQTRGTRSRGLLIPELLPLGGVERIVDVLGQMPLARYSPFRLVGVEPGGCAVEARWNGTTVGWAWHEGPPLCFASSGLGDDRVSPRLDLFERMVCAPGATADRQDQFHRHMWSERPEISVLMSREHARTVSIVTLEIEQTASGVAVRMAYEPVPDGSRVRPGADAVACGGSAPPAAAVRGL